MKTAIDTNLISALWSKEPSAADVARNLSAAKSEGGLAISAPVYAELLAYPGATEAFVNDFLSDTGIDVEFNLPQSVWLEAGRRFARYAKRRRRATDPGPKRLLADFIIGSHALTEADRFMTLDPQRYQRYFPDLKLA